jgi:Holliday junction resolvasome RuvABC endonuclease subunit
MNFKIKDIEKRLGFNLKKNTYCIGVDTASTTGLAMLETTNKTLIVKTSIFKLPVVKKEDELSDKFVEKLEFMLRSIRDFKAKEFGCKKASKTVLVLENSFMGCNVVTFGLLRMLCGIIFAELFDNFEEIKIIFPMSARKEIGFKSEIKRIKGATNKEKTQSRKDKKQELIDFVNKIFGTKETDDNICDALILALNGLKENQ